MSSCDGSCVALKDFKDMIHNITSPRVKPLLWVRYLGIPNWTWVNINSVGVVFLGFSQGFFPVTSLVFPHHLADLVCDCHFDQDCTATKSCHGNCCAFGPWIVVYTHTTHLLYGCIKKYFYSCVWILKITCCSKKMYFWICIIFSYPNFNLSKCYQLQTNILALTDLWILGCLN